MGPPDDLDALITDLNAAARRGPVGDAQLARLRSWIEHVVERSASDLMLVAGAPPSIRVNNAIIPLAEAPLDSEEIVDAVEPALAPHARRAFRIGRIADGS